MATIFINWSMALVARLLPLNSVVADSSCSMEFFEREEYVHLSKIQKAEQRLQTLSRACKSGSAFLSKTHTRTR